MKLRSLLAGFLTLALVMSMGAGLAETTVTDTFVLNVRELTLNPKTNTLAIRPEDANYYQICDAAGNPLSNVQYISCNVRNGLFEVAVQSGVNVIGLADGQGNELIPMAYGDVLYVSDKWQMGVILTDATAENYDYKAFGGDGFYLIDRIDVYFEGNKVGELARMDYKSATAYGNYLMVTSREGIKSYYDKNFTLNSQGDDLYGEYMYDYKTKTNTHLGSGQIAFTAGCTLTAGEVEESIYYANGQFFDLQGNLLFISPNPYDTVYDFDGDYAKVRWNGKYGLINKDGVEVLQCEYDAIDTTNGYLTSGYQLVVKDGKAGYVNAQGEVTCDFKYAASALKSSYKSPLTHLADMEGNMVVLSGAAGVLPETYKEVDIDADCPIFTALDANGNAGVVDLYGNAVVPFDGTYDSMYDFSVSADGTLVTGYQGNRTYAVYLLDHSEAAAPSVAETATEEQPAADGSWNCGTCGTANSGKFCTECGSAKPAAAPKCTNCGYEPDGTPKFCPECGTKF